MKQVKRLGLALLFLFAALASHAQQSATLGREFYVAFRQNYTNHGGLYIRYVVTKPCSITTQYIEDGSYVDNNQHYEPGVYTKQVDFAKSQILWLFEGPAGTIYTGKTTKGLKITSTENIALYAMNLRSELTDGTCILPVTAMGTEYAVISCRSQQPTIYVMATQPNTTFTIKHQNGTTVATETLATVGEGFYYMIMSPSKIGGLWNSQPPEDLMGYSVEADKPVAVFSSSWMSGEVSAGAEDHVYEQIWPRNTAGRNYFVWDLNSRANSYNRASATVVPQDRIRVMATQNYTTVTLSGTPYYPNAFCGTSSTPFPTTHTVHARNWIEFSLSQDTVYKDNSPLPVKITADKPVIVSRVLGFAPALMWTAPVEQRITSTVIAPFVPTPGVLSAIVRQLLHVMIPAGSQDNMTVKETWNNGDSVAFVNLRFYTNTVDPNYVIATKQYNTNDNVQIVLTNPAGMIAYMTGEGNWESYGYSAGAGAADLQQAYFMIRTKTPPHSAIFYKNTTAEMHSFQGDDMISITRLIEKTFTSVSWLVNGAPYAAAVENLSASSHSLTIPASLLNMGENTISMSVRYNGETADSVYAGKVWRSVPPDAKDDRMAVFACGSSTANVLANDVNAAGGSLTIAIQGKRGTATVDGGTAILYRHDHADCATQGGRRDTVKYSICTPAGCDSARLVIDLLHVPSIVLHDSCSRHPWLTVNYRYPAAVYNWLVSNDGGANWTPVPGSPHLKLYATEEAWYKVEITYKGMVVETPPAHFVVKRKSRLQGNLWWYVTFLEL
ncbi:MAG: IgGFc-binding protein [Prevotellaceae bacterium]|jgi:hypothetical protein|nr:IgGFc-binding protein [Prevotellaceae bacterium]